MDFLTFGAIFVDFSEARDLFVNIFPISDRNEKFVDRRLISENPRGLCVKSAKSGPRVNFTKVQGSLCKNAGEFSAGNYFPTDKSVDRPGVLGPPWIDTEADRGHDGALTGAWPSAAPVRLSSPAGAQNAEGSTGSSARASLEHERCCGSRATVVQNREVTTLGEDTAQVCREGKEAGERCGATRGWCSSFIGAGEAPGRKCRWVMAGDLRPTPLMAGEGVNGASRGEIKAGE
jgi:hypothetical protein